MSARRINRLPIAVAALALFLAGCTGLKPGSYKLTQPGGIGPANMQVTLCSLKVTPAEGENPGGVACGASGEPAEHQNLLTLMVPVGSEVPLTLKVAPGPGTPAIAFSRSNELTAQQNQTEFSPGAIGPPAGFEFVGFLSTPFADAGTQELTWGLESGIGLPPGAGGGSYGGPFKVSALVGSRFVTPTRPASRPVNCTEEKPEEGTFCGNFSTEAESTLGVSDLKIANPAPVSTAPGTKLKVPFVFDFASSATELPKFKLTTASTLPEAQLSLSNATFTRGPSQPGNRATPASRKAIVQVPDTAPFGQYELTLTATAPQGGATSAVTTISVKPKGGGGVAVLHKMPARAARARGIPVKLTAPIAGTRFRIVLKGPGPNGRGLVRLRRRVSVAKRLGVSTLRLRLPRARAEEFVDDPAPTLLKVIARIDVPGLSRPKFVGGALKLR